MALCNQLALHNIMNERNILGTPGLRAEVASISFEQQGNALVFLEYNTEELTGLPDGCRIYTVANVHNLLDYLPTILIDKI